MGNIIYTNLFEGSFKKLKGRIVNTLWRGDADLSRHIQ